MINLMVGFRPLARTFLPILILSGGLGVGISPAQATPRWTPLGPVGGRVGLLAQSRSDPSRLYAATERVGLFRSRDGGNSWESIRAGLTGGYLSNLAVAPSDPDQVIAVTYGGFPFDQVWHSEDGGTTWTQAVRPPAGSSSFPFVADLLFASGNPRTVYASREDGIWRSLDGGATWDAWALPNVPTGALAQSEQAPATFFAAGHDVGDFHGAIYRSDDGGVTWRETPSIGGPGFDELPYRLFFHAGVLFAQWKGALYRSTDGATAWSLAARLPTLFALDFAIAPLGTIYAATETGAYSSTDGLHWSPSEVTSTDQATPRDGLSHLAVVSGGSRPDRERVIAGGRRGFWRSTDRGASWRPASRGITVHDVQDLIVLPNSQGTVLGSFDDGLYRIDRAGDHWQRLPNPQGLELPYLAEDPHHPGRVYALGPLDVGVSDDRGNSWRKVGELPNDSVFLFRADPVHANVLYAGLLVGRGSNADEFSYRSVDGGATWRELPDLDLLVDFTFDPTRPQVGYRATFSGLDKTTDGGNHWTTLPEIATQLNGARTTAVLLDPKTRSLYVGTSDQGVFRSNDSGRTFRRINGGLPRGETDLPGNKPNVSALLTDAAGDIYVSLAYAGVFRLERGQGWKAVNLGLPLDEFSGVLVADPQIPGLLYAGSLGSSVLRLENC